MNLTPDTEEFIKNLNGKPVYELGYEDARLFLETLQEKYRDPSFFTDEIQTEIFYTGLNTKVYVIKPENYKNEASSILYLHGGGWVLGSKNSYCDFINRLSIATGCKVIFIEYSLSPEAKYPSALNEISAVFDEIENFKINSKKLIIAGDSAGGNMALAGALRAFKKGINFDLVLLFYPVIDASMETESYMEFEDGPWLSKKAMEWFFNAYCPDKNERKNAEISPINLSEREISVLKEVFIITAENDVLRDEGEEFARKLYDAKVKTTCMRANGTCHDFMVLNALKNTKPAQAVFLLVCAKIKMLTESLL